MIQVFDISMKQIFKDNALLQIKILRKIESEIANKWGGKKRLLKIIPSNVALKFERAEWMFKESLKEHNYKKIFSMCEMMQRAYDAIIEAATDNGYVELDPNVSCYKYNKDKYVLIVGNDYELENVYDKYKQEQDCIIFSIEELFRCIPEHCIDAKEELTQSNLSPTFNKIDYVKR
tara:strand:- start:7 stop:534 length:528 start_codon:yes stop_codon:yes gene_type:complete